MRVTLAQHPVGQGGLMSGLLNIPGGSFHWVYDCGSNQADALNREIANIRVQGEVDCLFLSHLDSDHVNGIDRLISAVPVREVVLPYLNDLDRVVAAAHDATTGAVTGTFLTFLDNIEGWFGARGVERISYIMPNSDDDEGGGGPDLPEGGEGGGEGKITAKWSREGKVASVDSENSDHLGVQRTRPSVHRMAMGASLQIMSGHRQLDWLLIPYAHRPSNKVLAVFEAALQSKFHGHHKDADFLASTLRHSSTRQELRDCYDLIWSDHNLVSMALYAGPKRSSRWQSHCVKWPRWRWQYPHHAGAVGWLCVGDMHLNVGRRRRAFLAYYEKLLDQVNVFGLPHHGSHRNFDSSLLSTLPRASQCIAAAGPNSYGHPDKGVIRAVVANGKDFVRVSEKIHSALEWKHYT
ncbi:MAG: MBL fold metallo-hydrolase [Alphaproteobacteria bacterium]